ncbi:MAG: hypothetical protein ACI8XM_002872 [Haloarculaceae archaeon]|jgi:hypothetical protein
MAVEGMKHTKIADKTEVDSPGLSKPGGFAKVGEGTRRTK